MTPRTLLFIHGMYMTPLCWEGWIVRFGDRGHRCLAPAWPGRDEVVETLRARHPDPRLGRLSLADVLDRYETLIRSLHEKPVLVGHSMGGLIVQLLLQRGLASAGIALDSAPPAGLFTPSWSFLKANWGHIHPFAPPGRPVEMSFRRFQYAFMNGLPLQAQREAYARYVVPESRRVPLQSLTRLARVAFRKPGAPLLLIAGEADHIIPASLNRRNHRKYERPDSITDFKSFPGRTHFILGQEGWEEVADFCEAWIGRLPA